MDMINNAVELSDDSLSSSCVVAFITDFAFL